NQVVRVVFRTIGGLLNFLLILVYVFFFLLYREKHLKFMLKLNRKNDDQKLKRMIQKSAQTGIGYLVGRILSIFILSVMYSIALIAVDVKHAIIFATMAALFTIVPYVGTFIGSLLPALMALLIYSVEKSVIVLFVMGFVQFIDE